MKYVKNILNTTKKTIQIDQNYIDRVGSIIEKKETDLRDKFAGLAMQGIMVGDNPASHHPETVAQWSYSIADAMLKQRKM